MPRSTVCSISSARHRGSYSKVRELTRLAGRTDEAHLVELARTATASQLQRTVRGFRRHDPDRLEQELRRKLRWRVGEDGAVCLSATPPAEEGALVVAALELAADRIRHRDGPVDTGSDRAGGVQVRAGCRDQASDTTSVNPVDALLMMTQHLLETAADDSSGADRHLVVVHVDAPTLVRGAGGELVAGPTDEPIGVLALPNSAGSAPEPAVPVDPCQIQGIGGVTPATAARLACDAVVVGVVPGGAGGRSCTTVTVGGWCRRPSAAP